MQKEHADCLWKYSNVNRCGAKQAFELLWIVIVSDVSNGSISQITIQPMF